MIADDFIIELDAGVVAAMQCIAERPETAEQIVSVLDDDYRLIPAADSPATASSGPPRRRPANADGVAS